MGLTLDLTPPDEEEGLWPEHEPAWRAWCAVCGQWRTEALSTMTTARVIWIGLDYSAARAALDLAGMEMTPALWAEVRAIEQGAVKELNKDAG